MPVVLHVQLSIIIYTIVSVQSIVLTVLFSPLFVFALHFN